MKSNIQLLLRISWFSFIALSLLAGTAQAERTLDGFAPNPNGTIECIVVEPGGTILVGGHFTEIGGVSRTNLARLYPDGSVCETFNVPAIRTNNYSAVSRLALQPDGKILVAGPFENLGGYAIENIGRLHSDGSVDTSFHPRVSGGVNALAVQADGKILVGGKFLLYGVSAHDCLGRINPDGSVDDSFNPNVNFTVSCLALQPDGKIVVGGGFTLLNGMVRRSIGRLNADGSLDQTFAPGASSQVSSLALERDGKILAGGYYTNIAGVARTGLARLHADGSLDSLFAPVLEAAATRGVSQLTLQRDGKILIGGYFSGIDGTAGSNVARLNIDGTVDRGFRANLAGIEPYTAGNLLAMAIQPDGKILLGGSFTAMSGLPRNGLGRLYPDGAIDGSLNIQGFLNHIRCLALQPDGKILAAGSIASIGGVPASYAARIHPDGSTDRTFTTNFSANNGLSSLVLQEDGRILVGGAYSWLNGQPRSCLGRVFPDGTLDPNFDPGVDRNLDILVLQPDGKILVGGNFMALAGESNCALGRITSEGAPDPSFPKSIAGIASVYSIAVQDDDKIVLGGSIGKLGTNVVRALGRIYSDGRVDPAFNPAPNQTVHNLMMQSDGKILVAGGFITLAGEARNCLGRLHADGSLDESFNPAPNTNVLCMALQTDGKIIVGGKFTNICGVAANYIARLNPDGSLDSTYEGGADASVQSIAIQPDGQVVVGGDFTNLAVRACNHIGRLAASGVALQELTHSPDGTRLAWTRTGASPEVYQVTFEQSLDGTNYILLGRAQRVQNGWELTKLSLPLGRPFYIRARGRTMGGTYSASSGLVETVQQFFRCPPDLRVRRMEKPPKVEISFGWPSGATHFIVASTNVTLPASDWPIVGEATLSSNGTYRFAEPIDKNVTRRFYRLRFP